MTYRGRSSALALMLVGLAVLAAACGDGESSEAAATELADAATLGPAVVETSNLSIHDAVVPAPPADVAALYFTMVDRDGDGDRLLGVTTSVAAMTALHASVTDGDIARMLPVEGGVVLPPGGRTELAPGGLHVMLMAMQEPLAAGDTIEVTLQFERAGPVTIDVPVRASADPQADND